MAATVLDERLDEMLAHTEGTRAGADPEELHDMRVASRRLRAALEAFTTCYHDKAFKQVVRETKQLTDALGGVRDNDVLLARMEAYARTVPPDEAPAIARFVGHVRAEREEHRTAMLRTLDALGAAEYAERFRAVIKHPDH